MKGVISLRLQRDFYLSQRKICFNEVWNRSGVILKEYYAENKQQELKCHILLTHRVEESK